MTNIDEKALNGVLPDPRSEIDIEKDFNHEELIPTAVVLNWNRDRSNEPSYSVRDQDGSSSCVGQAVAKALEIITGVVQSAHPIYRRRGNYPGLGMWLQDAFDIVRHLGTTTEVLDKSQGIDESQMNRDIIVQTPVTQPTYVRISPIDINAIATAIETQKQCPLTVSSSYGEWDVLKPIVSLNTQPTFGHAVTGMYYFTDENGNKCITIEESWGFHQIQKRLLTEDFLRARCNGAMYWVKEVIPPVPVKPKFHFQSVLLYGQSNYSVHMLQECLKYEGFFPKIATTQYFGLISAKALLAWQKVHQVAGLEELNSLMGKRAGQKTIDALNKIYAF